LPNKPCSHCKKELSEHGWIQTPEGEHIVCPGDYVVKESGGSKYPCKPNVFFKTYELVENG